MPIEVPKGLPFSVDTWSPSSRFKRYHFLTHAHKDHIPLSPHLAPYPIYASPLTKSILLRQFHLLQVDESLFVEIEVGQTLAIDDPDDPFSVTAFDANHCPGAVMFLFEGNFGKILHTGDCRLTHDCLQKLPDKYLAKKGKEHQGCLDYVFLDCTFSRDPMKIPSKHMAIQQVLNCIWNHPNAPIIYLACDMLGQEKILEAVFETFGSKIYVDKTKFGEYYEVLKLIVPHVLSEDPSSRFQVFEGFPRLYERASKIIALARADLQHEPLFIRPSAQWYACEERVEIRKHKLRFDMAERDEHGVWHVCFSMHSSKEELEWALELLRPKRVISTTPPSRSFDLDYVKRHCLTSPTADDSLWKVLKICMESSTSEDSIQKEIVTCSNVPRVQSVQERPFVNETKFLLDLSSPNAKLLTLFGRARQGLSSSEHLHGKTGMKTILNGSKEQQSLMDKLLERSETLAFSVQLKDEEKAPSIDADTVLVQKKSNLEGVLTMGPKDEANSQLEKNLNTSLRKLYRSMNVAVPRPLPSLVELMGVSKRTRFESATRRISFRRRDSPNPYFF